MFFRRYSLRACIAGLAMTAGLVAMTASMTTPVMAQNVLAIVNRVPITNFDVAQRIRIAALTERRRLDNRAALQELIDDQVKILEARRVGYRITDEGVDQEFTRLARSNQQDRGQFEQNLRRAGIEPNALREKLRANSAWQVLLRDQARRGTQISNEEIDRAVEAERKKRGEIIDYELQSVIFAIGSGQSAGERERAANAARSRFTSCEAGLESFRELKDVAIRPTVLRSTEGMNPQLVKLLDRTPVGRLTPPYRTDQGIEMVAVCGKKTRDISGSIRQDVAAQLAETRVTSNAQAYLAELRKKVDIRMMR